MSEEPLTQQQSSSVDHILAAGEHLLALISDILDFAKIESVGTDVFLEDVSEPPVTLHNVTGGPESIESICPSNFGAILIDEKV